MYMKFRKEICSIFVATSLTTQDSCKPSYGKLIK